MTRHFIVSLGIQVNLSRFSPSNRRHPNSSNRTAMKHSFVKKNAVFYRRSSPKRNPSIRCYSVNIAARNQSLTTEQLSIKGILKSPRDISRIRSADANTCYGSMQTARCTHRFVFCSQHVQELHILFLDSPSAATCCLL